jgi:hypothetical protein
MRFIPHCIPGQIIASYRVTKLNNHQLKAGGLKIGGLNRRLKEKAAESRWFAARAERPSGGLKAALWKSNNYEKGCGMMAVTVHPPL